MMFIGGVGVNGGDVVDTCICVRCVILQGCSSVSIQQSTLNETLKCYSQILCGGYGEILEFGYFVLIW